MCRSVVVVLPTIASVPGGASRMNRSQRMFADTVLPDRTEPCQMFSRAVAPATAARCFGDRRLTVRIVAGEVVEVAVHVGVVGAGRGRLAWLAGEAVEELGDCAELGGDVPAAVVGVAGGDLV